MPEINVELLREVIERERSRRDMHTSIALVERQKKSRVARDRYMAAWGRAIIHNGTVDALLAAVGEGPDNWEMPNTDVLA